VTVAFFNSGEFGFIADYLGGPLSVQIWGSFANGSLFSLHVPVTGSAVLKKTDDSISGDWQGSGFKFKGTKLDTKHSEYVVTVNNSAIGTYGTITLKAVSSSCPDLGIHNRD
jgi:hypothetical protein